MEKIKKDTKMANCEDVTFRISKSGIAFFTPYTTLSTCLIK